jgi:hypothetical protein
VSQEDADQNGRVDEAEADDPGAGEDLQAGGELGILEDLIAIGVADAPGQSDEEGGKTGDDKKKDIQPGPRGNAQAPPFIL